MLQPDHRVLLTDALQPPVGYSVDHAVTTTYSLSLNATLIAPMTFATAAAHDVGAEAEQPTVQMLDAVQRYVDRTTVFVQAGGIHVPRSHSRILTFLEDSILEVEPPRSVGSFHPKIWAVRYRNDANEAHHRLIISSRNLTFDNSWDTILVLDEDPTGTIDGQPVAEFIGALPGLTIREMSDTRQREVLSLADSLTGRTFAPPAPYTHGELLPLGITQDDWSFPTHATSAVIISPFISARQLGQARPTDGESVLVSRAESMDELGRDQLTDWQTRVLHAVLDTPDEDDDEYLHDAAGLHAKTAVYDLTGDESVTITGSANFTYAAWHRNVEFNAVLYGPTDRTGTAAILGREEELGLSSIIEPYQPAQPEPVTNAAQQLRHEIEQFHRQLARTDPVLDLSITDPQTVSAALRLQVPEHQFGPRTRLWLTTAPGDRRTLGDFRPWEVAPVNVTSFLAVETTVGSVVRSCVLTCRLTGEAVDRRRAALTVMLSNPDRVLQYIALLIGIDTPGRVHEVLATEEHATGITLPNTATPSPKLTRPVLFEPLMRATRNPKQLAQIASQIKELRSLPTADELLPPDFLDLWDTVVAATLSGGHQ